MTARTAERHAPSPERARTRGNDQRGDYAVFIAVIASALLLFGGIAYEAPRLNATRQNALHAANEAARVAAITVASGGTMDQARQAAENRLSKSAALYGRDIRVAVVDCVGSRVQVTVSTGYVFRSILSTVRPWQPIEAVGAAEAHLVQPSGAASGMHYLGECPLT